LVSETPHGLIAHLVDAMEMRGHDPRGRAERMTLGCVGQVGAQGGHVALVSKLKAMLPDQVAAHSLNNFCASGLSAVGAAAAAVVSGQAQWALGGGVEMLSMVAFMADRADYYTASDMPPDRRYIQVALAADMLAEKEGITRAELDAVAMESQARAAAAEDRPELLASRIAVAGLDREEAVRPMTLERLQALPPAFPSLVEAYRDILGDRVIDHRHTVAHAPPMTDGAALALVGPREGAIARIVAHAEVGGDPWDSLTAGFAAMDRALAKAGMTLADMDRIEFMEAFAVTHAKFLRDRTPDPARVNVSGGHVAKGHPMGATGAILLSTLIDALAASGGTLGLVVATGAQGVGVATIVERIG
jgi:acetyl-CoA C-acetyltransferase